VAIKCRVDYVRHVVRTQIEDTTGPHQLGEHAPQMFQLRFW
jgi:hypothetical protein